NTNTQSLDLSQYADGIYFLSVGMDNGQTMVKKIMVE
ncbi:T9SS type A sorting domain-containing protein, partial [Winogradskyella sp.]